MELQEVLSAIGNWPIEDRLRLMEEIWDGLIDHGFEPEVTQDLKEKLDRRLDSLDINPDDVTTWEAIKRQVRQE